MKIKNGMLLTGLALAALTMTAGTAQAGNYCREYTRTIAVGGRFESGYGTACRQPDGSWQITGWNGAAAPPDRGPDGAPAYYPDGPSVHTIITNRPVYRRPMFWFSYSEGRPVHRYRHHHYHHDNGWHHGKHKWKGHDRDRGHDRDHDHRDGDRRR